MNNYANSQKLHISIPANLKDVQTCQTDKVIKKWKHEEEE